MENNQLQAELKKAKDEIQLAETHVGQYPYRSHTVSNVFNFCKQNKMAKAVYI